MITRRLAVANWTCVSWVAYAPGTIAVNVTWIEREFNACQTPRNMYPSIFNHFWDIGAVYRWRVTGFQQYGTRERMSVFNHILLSWVRHWDNRGKCYMGRKRIECLSNASQHVHIYLEPFTNYSEILVGNCNFFLPPLAFNAPVRSGPCYMDRKRIECLLNASQHVPIFLQPFPSNSSHKIQKSSF